MKENAIQVCMFSALIGIVLEFFYFTSSLAYTSRYFFFGILLTVAFPTLFMIFFKPQKKFYVCFLIGLTSLFVNLIYLYFSKDLPYIPTYDTIYHWKIADAITTEHHIEILGTINGPNPLFNFSSYPGFHLLLAILGMTTGIDSIVVVKIFPLIYVITPFLIFLISREVFHSDQVSFLAAYLYIFTPMMQPVPSYSILAIVFFLMLILFLLKHQITKKQEYFFLGLLSMFLISITHHLTTYIALGMIFFVFVIPRIIDFPKHSFNLKRKSWESILTTYTLVFLILGLAWTTLVASSVFDEVLGLIRRWIILRVPSSEGYQTAIMSYYPSAEMWFIILSLVSVGLIGLLGFFRYIRKRSQNIDFILIAVYFGIIMFVILSGWYTSTAMKALGTRTFRFTFIFLAPLVGFALFKLNSNHKKEKLRKITAILILLCFTVSAVDLLPWEYFDFSHEENIGWLSAVRKYNGSLYSSLVFFNNSVPNGSTAVGDVPIHDFGDGMLNLSIVYFDQLYREPSMIKQNFMYLRQIEANYIFVDYLQSIYKQLPTYAIVTDIVPVSNLDSLVNNYAFPSVYNNGEIIILYCPD